MKSKLFPALIAMAIFCLSCSKSSNDLVHDSHTAEDRTESIVNQVSTLKGMRQKVAYSLMDEFEKAAYWTKRMDRLKGLKNTTQVQRNFIAEISSMITPDLFKIGSDNNNKFKRVIEKQLVQKGSIIFPANDLQFILGDLSFKSLPSQRVIARSTVEDGESGGGEKKCTCSMSSDYCGLSKECRAKKNDPCKTTTLGCGALLVYSCDGDCFSI